MALKFQRGSRSGSGRGQGLDQIQFVALLTGEDRRPFVVFHQLLHGLELALSDAVLVVLQLHFEMFVFGLGLQRYGEIVRLQRNRKIRKG